MKSSKANGIALAVIGVIVLSGCSGSLGPAARRPVFLAVDFELSQPLRYRFVSERDITLDLAPEATAGADRLQKQSERLEVIMAYTPVEVNAYGASVIEAVCESVEVTRSRGPAGRSLGPDAATVAQGRRFKLKVDPRGRILDRSELRQLISEMGQAAFRQGSSQGRVKEQEMIGDFVAGQWFLWDAISSVEDPARGVATGQTWSSKLPVPTPMVMREARDVTYRLAEIRDSDTGSLAVIESAYILAESTPTSWPIPYSGRFRMSGTYGFLGSYRIVKLEGSGQELFNINAGRLERQQQRYTLEAVASVPPMGIRANLRITIDQTLTVARLDW